MLKEPRQSYRSSCWAAAVSKTASTDKSFEANCIAAKTGLGFFPEAARMWAQQRHQSHAQAGSLDCGCNSLMAVPLSLAACSLTLCVDSVVLTFAAGLVTFSLGQTCKLPLLQQPKQVTWIALSEPLDSSSGYIDSIRHVLICYRCKAA